MAHVIEAATSGRAKCRCCRKAISYEEGRFEPSGFTHLGCTRDYFETIDILAQIESVLRSAAE